MTDPMTATNRAIRSQAGAAVCLGPIALLICQLAACANTAQPQVPDEPVFAPASDFQLAEQEQTREQPNGTDSTDTEQKTPKGEVDIEDVASPEDKEALLDKTQRTVYAVVNGTSQWFDSFFGSTEFSEGANVSWGLVSVGSRWDQRDGFKPRFRLKARFPLPALKQRGRSFSVAEMPMISSTVLTVIPATHCPAGSTTSKTRTGYWDSVTVATVHWRKDSIWG